METSQTIATIEKCGQSRLEVQCHSTELEITENIENDDFSTDENESHDEGEKCESLDDDKKKKKKSKKFLYDEQEQERRRISANMMERNRMKSMNDALSCLRDKLPEEFKLKNKRMSKIRTLRVAISYIRSLREMLNADDKNRHEQMTREQTILQNYYQSLAAQWNYSNGHLFQFQASPINAVTHGPRLGPTNSRLETPCTPLRSPYLSCLLSPLTPTPGKYNMNSSPSSCNLDAYQRSSSESARKRQRIFKGSPESIYSPLNLVKKFPYYCSANQDKSRNSGPIPHFPSPMFHRNMHELNTSFLSAASDDAVDPGNPQAEFGIDGVYPLTEETGSGTKTLVHQSYYV